MRWGYVGLFLFVLFANWVLMSPANPPVGSGTIEGKVTFAGTPPKMKPIDMGKEPACAKMYNSTQLTQSVVTGPGNALQYVVVYISAGETSSPAPAEPVRFDQKGCMYVPHVLPLQVGQVIEIYTDDPLAHNIHPLPKANTEWNRAQPAGARPILTAWDKAEFIEVKCNIHPWMHSYFAVLKTSHYAMTDNKGSFSLTGLAPGRYTVTAWHELFGTQNQEVTIGEAETKAIDFLYKVSQ
jgi:Carboxypeptidase regulatory-like domain